MSEMSGKTVSRTAPCPCGSGKMYMHCCEGRPPASRRAPWRLILLSLIALVVLAFAAVTIMRPVSTEPPPPPGGGGQSPQTSP